MKFTITCNMEERWAKTFCAMLHEMEVYGKMGHSDWASIYSDGDGDFKSKFILPDKISWNEASRVEYENYYNKDGNYIECSTHGTQKEGQIPLGQINNTDDSHHSGARLDDDYCSKEEYKRKLKYVEIPYKNMFGNDRGVIKCIVTDLEDDVIHIKYVKEEALDAKFLPSIDKYCKKHYGITLKELVAERL